MSEVTEAFYLGLESDRGRYQARHLAVWKVVLLLMLVWVQLFDSFRVYRYEGDDVKRKSWQVDEATPKFQVGRKIWIYLLTFRT